MEHQRSGRGNMASMEVKHTDAPDETRPFADKGRAQVVRVGDTTIVRGTFEPGWRWSQHVKPLVGTESCQAAHTGYMVAGRMHIQMDDGSAQEVGAGDAVYIPVLGRRQRAPARVGGRASRPEGGPHRGLGYPGELRGQG